MARFLLDENLPARAARLMSSFGYPMLAVGEIPELPRGSSDASIADWCGRHDVVWITVDRGILKDEAIVAAMIGSRTSVLLIPGKGMNARDYLRLLVNGCDRWERAIRDSRGPLRARIRRGGSLTPASLSPP